VTELKITTSNYWSGAQAFTLAAVALLLGLCGGWLIRRSTAATAAPTTSGQIASMPSPAANPNQPAQPNFGSMAGLPSAEELKKAADEQAAPLLEHLKTDPNNADLLAHVGNIYYDVKQYPTAIDYYERSLKTQANNSSVRTDLGTAYWYTGNADAAIAQFNKALSYEPNKADTLFNLGVVEWQGKKDVNGAVATWKKLLDTNPNYEARDKVLQIMAQAKQSAGKNP
jgi:tetratricopeptide (TPR) repeat protein